jgi:hypothetical protein
MIKMIKMNKKSSTVAELVSSVTGVNERGERVGFRPLTGLRNMKYSKKG